ETFETNIVRAFRFYAASILMTSLYQVMMSSLNGLQEIKYKVLSNEIIGSAAKIVSLVLFVFFGWDLYAALGSNLVQDAVILSVSLFFLLKVFPKLKDFSFKPEYEKNKMNKFAAALFTNSLLSKYTFQLDILFLGFFTTMREVGIYTVALRLQPLIYLPHYTIGTIFGPLVAELHAAKKFEELESLYKTVTKWSFSMSLPIYATIILFSNEILNVFGKDFSEGVLIILLMSTGNLIHDFLGLSGNIIMMTGRINVNLANSAVMAVVNVVLYYFFIKSYGILGAAISNGLSMIILNTMTVIEVRHYLGWYPFKKSLLKPIFSLVVSAFFVELLLLIYRLPLYQFTFVIYIFSLWGFYILGLFLLKFDNEDVFIIKKIAKRFSFVQRLLPKSYR
ncbi:polysaccharide biosynthesis C-terminal domain-containing protein, partial [bacterium]|nr:polysaccharide biosynthesis C-terminal domain-containing protein [bacterium]